MLTCFSNFVKMDYIIRFTMILSSKSLYLPILEISDYNNSEQYKSSDTVVIIKSPWRTFLGLVSYKIREFAGLYPSKSDHYDIQ